jgi:hypothetical protein
LFQKIFHDLVDTLEYLFKGILYIEGGPPDDLVGTLQRMFDEKMRATQNRSSDTLASLGWTEQFQAR